MKSVTITILVAVAAVAVLTGCSSFHREWKAATHGPLPASGITGPWEGRWVSDVNGHGDKLRCVITSTSTNGLNAHFHANYRTVFRFGYTVPLQATETADGYRFSGEADLGKMAGGEYTYEGHANGINFFSTYNSKYDHGRFEMTRPQAK